MADESYPQSLSLRGPSAQLVGAFAEAVQERLAETLAERLPAFDWTTEHYVSGTPVDVAGIDDGRLAVVDLEWRRIRQRWERMLVGERAKRVD